MKRGEIWWASLPGPMGRRPVLVVQANAFNASRIGTVVVALITSNLGVEAGPGNVRLARGDGGLSKPSVVNVSQLMTFDRNRLTERLGVLEPFAQQRVDAGLRLVLDLAGGGGRVMDAAAEYVVGNPADVHAVAARLRELTRNRPKDKPAEELIREMRDGTR